MAKKHKSLSIKETRRLLGAEKPSPGDKPPIVVHPLIDILTSKKKRKK